MSVAVAEVASAHKNYDHKCDFFRRKLKTRKAILLHRGSCVHQYDTTDEAFPVEEIARWRPCSCSDGPNPDGCYSNTGTKDMNNQNDSQSSCCDETDATLQSETSGARVGWHQIKNFMLTMTILDVVCVRDCINDDKISKCTRQRLKITTWQSRFLVKTVIIVATVQKRNEMQKAKPKVKWGEIKAGMHDDLHIWGK